MKQIDLSKNLIKVFFIIRGGSRRVAKLLQDDSIIIAFDFMENIALPIEILLPF